MIHIFVNENYNKDLIKNLLEYINDTIGKELTYGVNTKDYDKDVVVEISNSIDKEDMRFLSSLPQFKDDLCIFAGTGYCEAFLNGHPASIRKYVGRMI